MTTISATLPFPARLRTELQIDSVLLLIVSALLLGGLVILASASITVSDKVVGEPFFYVQRQLLRVGARRKRCFFSSGEAPQTPLRARRDELDMGAI